MKVMSIAGNLDMKKHGKSAFREENLVIGQSYALTTDYEVLHRSKYFVVCALTHEFQLGVILFYVKFQGSNQRR